MTHAIFNQVDELTDVNLLTADPALAEALQRAGASWALPAGQLRRHPGRRRHLAPGRGSQPPHARPAQL